MSDSERGEGTLKCFVDKDGSASVVCLGTDLLHSNYLGAIKLIMCWCFVKQHTFKEIKTLFITNIPKFEFKNNISKEVESSHANHSQYISYTTVRYYFFACPSLCKWRLYSLCCICTLLLAFEPSAFSSIYLICPSHTF